MKSVFKIYWKYVTSACLLVIFWIFINLAVWFGYVICTSREQFVLNASGQVRTGQYQRVAEQLLFVEGRYEMQEAGLKILRDNGCAFCFLLDQNGSMVWDWQCPPEMPAHFSVAEAAVFSKWYLKDYPVSVWRYGQQGLMVFGYPKGSIVRFNLLWKRQELDRILDYVGVFFLCNAGLVILLALLFGYRFYRSLKPVGEGVDALAEGRSARLQEKGTTQYLRKKINQASALLERQRKELKKRDMLRTEWITGVSHDIRTPLSLIAGYADALERDAALPEDVRRSAGLIREQSFSIKNLVEDLNLTSRLAYHMEPLRRESYVPAAWLRQTAARMLDGGEIGEDFALFVKIAPELETIRLTGDVALLTRALRNLLGNCVRHNPGGCQIRLEARPIENGFCFFVEDDGKGVPQAVRRVLEEEPAVQPGNDKGPHVMGLRVVSQIARAHGGRLWFEQDGRRVWVSVRDQGQNPIK